MLVKERVPQDKKLDNSLALSKEGYLFIKNRLEQYRSDIFDTRLLGEKVICMSGEEAAKVFYDSELFKREGALPKRIQKTLVGAEGIQTMDGGAHMHQKLFLISLMDSEHQKRLAGLVMEKWQACARRWENAKEIVLFDEAKNILCEAACHWAGVPLAEFELEERASDFNALIDGFGAIGPRYWKGKMARTKTEDWIRGIIKDVRSGKLQTQENSILYMVSFAKDFDGKRLNSQKAAVELINILRPIVAISTFITFMALALHDYPQYKKQLMTGDKDELEIFVQEVRRYYPFTPFVGARVRKDFTWNQCEFKEGMLVLLDVYSNNHDSRIWNNPYEFIPERFKNWEDNSFNFIPQGGGGVTRGHRCPGEGITIEVMKITLDFLVNKIMFEVPDQDLSYSMARIPTLPKSGFVMNNIKRKI